MKKKQYLLLMLIYSLNSYSQSRLEYFSNEPVESIHLENQILVNTFNTYFDSFDYFLIESISDVLVLTNNIDIIENRNGLERLKYGNVDLIISYRDSILAFKAIQNLTKSFLVRRGVIYSYLKAGGYIYLDSNKLIISFINFYTSQNYDEIRLFMDKYKTLYEIKGSLKRIN